ncbi:hypothetical protein [Hasllibacter sp. MH4015]|uniref:hypothetical protein n=1 Tax=Hasllibacter sp. MH4015 TaxID=2854029 RepID=UPI001CD749EB|nr:hypothetical protein [Hasllibacter sp. MH4015]
MSGFFRPEAMAALSRWREVIAACIVAALGLWIATRPGGMVMTGFGYVLIAIAAIILVPALRRARFFTGSDGPGVVKVDEGRILYMGPVTGGSMALDDLKVLSVRRDGNDQTTWVLADPSQLLVIPVDAAGADALFDAFSALPGVNIDRLIQAVQSRTKGSQRLWVRDHPLALTP